MPFLHLADATAVAVQDCARGVIAGCTEIELMVGQEDVAMPYIRTTRMHALAAARWALAGPDPA